jgi:acyl-CoA dehydrogenase
MPVDALLLDSFVRLLKQVSPPAAVRRSERELDVGEILQAVEESGFLDALIPEASNGAGLALLEVAPLILAAGEHLLPIPFAETMIARALFAMAGVPSPPGKAIIFWPMTSAGQRLSIVDPPSGPGSLALVQRDTHFQLLPTQPAERCTDEFRVASAKPDFAASPLLTFTAAHINLTHLGAAVTAAYMAGAMHGLLEMSLKYVNERQQFGRTLSKFQVIQQQLCVFAERTVTAQVAARIGLVGINLALDGTRVAIAKSVANESARFCASAAHAVHGAIGISEAYDLQLFSRRLARWQLSFGSETYWQKQIARVRLASGENRSVDFVRFLHPAAATPQQSTDPSS